MSDVPQKDLTLMRLYYRQGSFAKALEQGLIFLTEPISRTAHHETLELVRITFQCALELSRLTEVAHLIEQVKQVDSPRATLILGMWDLAHAQPTLALVHFEKGLEHSMALNDHECSCRLLHALATTKLWLGELSDATLLVEKSMYLSRELQLDEIICSCLIIKSAISASAKKTDESLEFLWNAYELSKKRFYFNLQLNILVRLAKGYEAVGNRRMMQTYAELALRGLDENQFPRLFNAAKSMLELSAVEEVAADLQINKENLKVRVRNKGFVEFGHQHILFDLLMLFVTHPGKRFSKEELVGQVWNQIYEPLIHDNLIYVSIKRLRNILEPDQSSPIYVLRDRAGYFLSNSVLVRVDASEEAR